MSVNEDTIGRVTRISPESYRTIIEDLNAQGNVKIPQNIGTTTVQPVLPVFPTPVWSDGFIQRFTTLGHTFAEDNWDNRGDLHHYSIIRAMDFGYNTGTNTVTLMVTLEWDGFARNLRLYDLLALAPGGQISWGPHKLSSTNASQLSFSGFSGIRYIIPPNAQMVVTLGATGASTDLALTYSIEKRHIGIPFQG